MNRYLSISWAFALLLAACSDDADPSNSANAANSANSSNSANASNAANATNASNNINAANSVNAANNTTPSRAALLAKAEPYSRLIIEVDSVTGVEPEPIDTRVEDFLTDLVDKPDGIEFVRDQSVTGKGSEHVWTFDELKTIMAETDTLELQPNEMKIHVVFVDGGYENDSEDGVTLGLAWGSNVAMFGDTITRSCDGLLQDRLCLYSEASILLHEFGHVLGLVDNGAPLTSDHLDEENGKHCDNPDCLMYWQYEGSSLIEALRGKLNSGDETLFQLDTACLQDLAAIE